MTPTGDPLPSEDEADRLFREVAPARSMEARGWLRALRRRARPRPAAPQAPAQPPPAVSPRRATAPATRSARPGCIRAVVVVVGLLAAVVALLDDTNGGGDVDLWPFSFPSGARPPAPRTPAVEAPSVFVPGTGTCITRPPYTTDERVTVVDCSGPGPRHRIVARVELADGSYRGDGETWGEAVGLCGRTYGPTTAVVVPPRDDWFANGERTAVCLERVDA
ncbi:MAG: hypothetical protein HY830_23550 [Actinobacteria bacterium]|nr:hypothetical protein [Actinomycetota bacterium]